MPSNVDNFSVRRVCVDDFAIKKRFSYGTVMVDLDSHRIIDILPSRDVADVKEWLKEYPNIEYVSRDGAQIYASAVKASHPNAIQISDRFHLIKGLSEAVDKYIIRTFPARIEIPATTVVSEEIRQLMSVTSKAQRVKFAHEKKQMGMTVNEISVMLKISPKTVTQYLNLDPEMVKEEDTKKQEKHKLAVQQKKQDVEEARKLAQAGVSIEQIAKELHRHYKTIQNYLNPEFSLDNGHYKVRIPGKLAPYEDEVKNLRAQGVTYPKIHQIITNKGYTGSVASLRMFMQMERMRNSTSNEYEKVNSDYQPTEFVQRKSLSQLIYKNIEDVYLINTNQRDAVMAKFPILADLYAVIREFYSMMFSKKSDRIDAWLKTLEKLNIPEIQTYVNGVRKDIEAVTNGIKYEYNNGLAEGSVNKIKVIKRIMYGRNSFELLKAKVLFYEDFRFSIN